MIGGGFGISAGSGLGPGPALRKGKDGSLGRQVKGITPAPAEKLDPGIGLALVGFKIKRQISVVLF